MLLGILADDPIVLRNRENYNLLLSNVPEKSKLLYIGCENAFEDIALELFSTGYEEIACNWSVHVMKKTSL